MARLDNLKDSVALMAARARDWKRDLAHRAYLVCIGVGLFVAVSVFIKLPGVYDLLRYQQLQVQDQFFAWRDAWRGVFGGPSAPSDIVIVSIDEESISRFGAAPPWPRQLYAALLEELKGAGASVVGFDLIFEGPSPVSVGVGDGAMEKLKAGLPPAISRKWVSSPEADDRAFADALTDMDNVVLATNVDVSLSLYGRRSRLSFHTPYEPFIHSLGGDSRSLGNVVVEPDADGLVRRADLVFPEFRHLSGFFRSFALRLAEKRRQVQAVPYTRNQLVLDKLLYPASFTINYVGPSGSFPVVPFWKALEWRNYYEDPNALEERVPGRRDRLGPNPFYGKIVLVGHHLQPEEAEVAGGLVRQGRSLPVNGFLTPVSGVARPMSGVELQANILANTLSRRYFADADWWEKLLVIVFATALSCRMFGGLHGRPLRMLLAVAAFAGFWVSAAFLAFVYLRCLIPVAVPLLGIALPSCLLVLADQNVFAFKERRRHTRLFRDLAPARLANEIDRRRLGELGLEGKTAVVTTMLCQVKDFERLAAGRPAETVIQALNDCLHAMTSSVYEHSGIVDRMWKHGVLALWGAPLPMQEMSQARLAAGCFLDIQERLAELSRRMRAEGRMREDEPDLSCLFGINTGPAICGRIGTEAHSEYGAVGSSVDFAVLLESLCTVYDATCIVGDGTARLIVKQFAVRDLDKVKLEASGEPQYIHELVCRSGKMPGVLEEVVELYRQALAAMEERDFDEAERLFNTILSLRPQDRPTELMLKRCREYKETPPEPNWDGAVLVAPQARSQI